MADLLATETPEEIRAAEQRSVCVDAAAYFRLQADNLAYSIVMAEARGDDVSRSGIRLEVLLDYEAAMVKRSGRDLPRYVPNPLTGKHVGEKAA